MPRLVNCIKNCCYTLLLVAFVCAVSSLFVWQAEVYQQTIDEQVRLMKMDLSAMKKENHLMEVKLNEQFGKHEDLKEEFRYLLKQAKWSVNKDVESQDVVEKRENPKLPNKVANIVEAVVPVADLRGEVAKIGEVGGAGALDAALGVVKEEEEEMDLSKRTHILVLSERKGGGEELGRLLNQDTNLFYLPGISSVIKTSREFDQIAHCEISEKVVNFYKTHLATSLASTSLSKLCTDGNCDGLTSGSISAECLSKHVTLLEGTTENWDLKLIDSLSMEIAYVSRDARAIVSQLLEDGELTEEEVQVFASQLCARIDSFNSHSSSSHNVYEVFKYEKIAASPVTSISTLYHKLLDTTNIPTLNLTKDYKNALYLSINQWRDLLAQITVDAVNEECTGVLDS